MLGPLEKTSIQIFVVIFGRTPAPQPLWTRRSAYELVTFVCAITSILVSNHQRIIVAFVCKLC
jgi:hypothetical protein